MFIKLTQRIKINALKSFAEVLKENERKERKRSERKQTKEKGKIALVNARLNGLSIQDKLSDLLQFHFFLIHRNMYFSPPFPIIPLRNLVFTDIKE